MFCLGGYNILDLIHAYKISQIAQRQHDQVSAFKETSPGRGARQWTLHSVQVSKDGLTCVEVTWADTASGSNPEKYFSSLRISPSSCWKERWERC